MLLNNTHIMIIITVAILLTTIILDKLFNRYRITTFSIDIWISIFQVIKKMKNWKGIVSLIIVWLVLSGVVVVALGIIFKIKTLIIIGSSIFLFWAGPFTPLIPLVIGISLVIQRYIFRDKNVSLTLIKETFKEIRDKEK